MLRPASSCVLVAALHAGCGGWNQYDCGDVAGEPSDVTISPGAYQGYAVEPCAGENEGCRVVHGLGSRLIESGADTAFVHNVVDPALAPLDDCGCCASWGFEVAVWPDDWGCVDSIVRALGEALAAGNWGERVQVTAMAPACPD